MAALDAAHSRLKAAEDKASAITRAARIEFGRVIRQQRANGIPQSVIAKRYKLERETIRRYQEAADIADGLKPNKD